mmetsp:Transcript_143/g.180  ORF Transcript_143/g.180 Transcript_143/m.180 type:complete len:182 (+) Transcript_143:287-832(+)
MITAQMRNGINEPLSHSCVNLANLSKGRYFTVYLENPYSCDCLIVTLSANDRNGRESDVEPEYWKFSLLENGRRATQHMLLFDDDGRCTFDLSVNRTHCRNRAPLNHVHYVLNFYFLNANGQHIQTHRSVIHGRGHSYEWRHRNDYADRTVLLCPNFAQDRAIFETTEADLTAQAYPTFQI